MSTSLKVSTSNPSKDKWKKTQKSSKKWLRSNKRLKKRSKKRRRKRRRKRMLAREKLQVKKMPDLKLAKFPMRSQKKKDNQSISRPLTSNSKATVAKRSRKASSFQEKT